MPSTPWPGESPNLPVGCPRVVVGGPDVPFGGVTWPTSLSLRVNKLQYSKKNKIKVVKHTTQDKCQNKETTKTARDEFTPKDNENSKDK